MVWDNAVWSCMHQTLLLLLYWMRWPHHYLTCDHSVLQIRIFECSGPFARSDRPFFLLCTHSLLIVQWSGLDMTLQDCKTWALHLLADPLDSS